MTAHKPAADLLVNGAAELLTCRPDAPDLVGRIPNGSVAIAGERILAVGPAAEMARAVDLGRARVIDASGRTILPGFVDCHTHVVFGGSRVEEYAARLTGENVDSLAALGVPVGIRGTAALTRSLSVDQLVGQALPRLGEMLASGTTTAESKSGYGLSVESELDLLRVNRRLNETQPVDVLSTFLGAHAIPEDSSRATYVSAILEEMLPAVAAEGLAEFCDVYCDDGFYTLDESRRILEGGLEHGLQPKIHLDAYSHTGAAPLAAELGCVSADHLNLTPPEGIELLVDAGVTLVAMPALDLAVAHPQPLHARELVDAGGELALATDMCPGCWLTSMQLVIVLACRLQRLSVAEAVRAATLGAAAALGCEQEIGSLEPGKLADLIVLDVPRFEELAYRLGRNSVEKVVKRGVVVIDRVAA